MATPIPIVVDTREQRPYEFEPAAARVTRAALPAGDYSVLGHETRVAIERKSLADFVATVIHARARFSHELAALSKYEFAAVVIEAALEDVLEHRYGALVKPASVWGAALSIQVDYGVPVVWAGTRPVAAKWVLDVLGRWHARRARTVERAVDVAVEGAA
jgi:ERCC4-type nuclease